MGRQILEQAQEFIPEVNFLEHVDYVKGRVTLLGFHKLKIFMQTLFSSWNTIITASIS